MNKILFFSIFFNLLHAWAGGFLKTHDFLQVGKINAKEESTLEITSIVEKPPPPAPPPPSSSSVEHNLPGGIGTYSISHVSYFGQKVPKPEGSVFAVAQTSSTEKNDENSNCSSYTGSGFTLWEESAVKKGKTGKENARERAIGRGGNSVLYILQLRSHCLLYYDKIYPCIAKLNARCWCSKKCPWTQTTGPLGIWAACIAKYKC